MDSLKTVHSNCQYLQGGKLSFIRSLSSLSSTWLECCELSVTSVTGHERPLIFLFQGNSLFGSAFNSCLGGSVFWKMRERSRETREREKAALWISWCTIVHTVWHFWIMLSCICNRPAKGYIYGPSVAAHVALVPQLKIHKHTHIRTHAHTCTHLSHIARDGQSVKEGGLRLRQTSNSSRSADLRQNLWQYFPHGSSPTTLEKEGFLLHENNKCTNALRTHIKIWPETLFFCWFVFPLCMFRFHFMHFIHESKSYCSIKIITSALSFCVYDVRGIKHF